MVYRIFVEKKPGLDHEAKKLLGDICGLLQIESVTDVRLLNRYDVENIDAELFESCKRTVFSEPQLDIVTDKLPKENATVFAVEYLPGQFDQRADSPSSCPKRRQTKASSWRAQRKKRASSSATAAECSARSRWKKI